MVDSSNRTTPSHGPFNGGGRRFSGKTVGFSQAVLAQRVCGTVVKHGRIPVISLHIAARLVESRMRSRATLRDVGVSKSQSILEGDSAMKLIAPIAIVMSSAVVMLGLPAGNGVEIVVKVEAQRLAGQDVSEQTLRIIESQLPGGSAEVRYITDGKAVRSTLSGPMFGLEDGTVRLVPHDSADIQVLNPKDRTYRLAPQDSQMFAGQKREFEFHRSGNVKTILGQKTYQVTGRIRVDVPPIPGASVQVVHEVRADIENWCTSSVRVPAAMAKMIEMASRLVGSDDPRFAQYQATCPLALQSAARLSLFPGFELVSTPQSLRRLSQIPAGSFQLPTGYQRVTEGGVER